MGYLHPVTASKINQLLKSGDTQNRSTSGNGGAKSRKTWGVGVKFIKAVLREVRCAQYEKMPNRPDHWKTSV